MRLIYPRALAFGDDRAGSDAESGAEAEVINRAARRSGAVFRRVTPWRVRIDPQADDGGAGRIGATTSENQSRARVYRTRARDDEENNRRGCSPSRGGEKSGDIDVGTGRDAEEIPRQVRPQDPAGKPLSVNGR